MKSLKVVRVGLLLFSIAASAIIPVAFAQSDISVDKDLRQISSKDAPKFKVKSITGEEISMEKYRGKIVLIDFWATWCPPCRKEMPYIKEIATKFSGNDNFVLIGITLDTDRNALNRFIKTESISWPQYFEGTGWDNKISRLFGVSSIPNSVIVDQNGTMRYSGLHGEQLSYKIEEMLNQLPK